MNSQLLVHASVALALVFLGSCASTGTNELGEPTGSTIKSAGPEEPEPYKLLTKEERAIGFALAELDSSIQKWNSLVLTGDAAKDGPRLKYLEEAIRYRTNQSFEGLVDQVTTGPLINRQIAATALGFSGSPKALPPLLAAMLDSDSQVVANALLGLSILGLPDTPVGNIASKLSDRSQPTNVRVNAGRALRALRVGRLEGEERTSVLGAARSGLGDDEPSVAMNSALLLAELGDAESILAIAERLRHPSANVARAASRSLAYLGTIDATSKGPAVRALVACLPHVDNRAVRPFVYVDLQRVAGKNYGDDVDQWLKYANTLP